MRWSIPAPMPVQLALGIKPTSPNDSRKGMRPNYFNGNDFSVAREITSEDKATVASSSRAETPCWTVELFTAFPLLETFISGAVIPRLRTWATLQSRTAVTRVLFATYAALQKNGRNLSDANERDFESQCRYFQRDENRRQATKKEREELSK